MIKGSHHTPESREKSRLSHLGHSPSTETRAKISAIHKGRVKSAQERANISAGQKGQTRRPLSPEHRAKLQGRKQSVETIAKRSAALTGRVVSEATRAKLRMALRGHQDFTATAPIKGECVYCFAPARAHDHVVPRGRPGWADPDNVVFACHSCNASKGNRTPAEWLAQGLLRT